MIGESADAECELPALLEMIEVRHPLIYSRARTYLLSHARACYTLSHIVRQADMECLDPPERVYYERKAEREHKRYEREVRRDIAETSPRYIAETRWSRCVEDAISS